MFTVVIFFIVLSILVLIHELGHFTAAKLQDIKVEEFGFGLPPRLIGFRYGETLYSLNLLPFGGFVKVLGEEEAQLKGLKLSEKDKHRTFTSKKHWQKVIVLVAGVVMNFILGWFIVSYLFTKGVPVPSENVVVQEVAFNSPAEEAGIEPQDAIKAAIIDGERINVKTTEDVSQVAQDFAGERITLELLRDKSQKIEVELVPRQDPPEGEGSLGVVIANYEIEKYPIWKAPFVGLVETAKFTGLIFTELGKTLFKFVTFQEQTAQVAGPVGIANMTSQAARQGIDSLLQLIGLLSLNLAVLNILPFPALDGGRLVFVLYEWATGKKVNPNFEQKLNFIGFALLIGLLLLVTVQDIMNLPFFAGTQ